MMPPPYAGGHAGITHCDDGALAWLGERGCRSLLDVGCGPGGQVQTARARGWRAIGIDIDPELYRLPGVALTDLCVEPFVLPVPADVVWSVEVAEHIPPEATANYITTLVENTGRYLVMTASQAPMPAHVNIRPASQWRDLVSAAGLTPLNIGELLKASTMRREFLHTTGMLFERQG